MERHSACREWRVPPSEPDISGMASAPVVGGIIGVTERAGVANDANQRLLLPVSCQDGETAARISSFIIPSPRQVEVFRVKRCANKQSERRVAILDF